MDFVCKCVAPPPLAQFAVQVFSLIKLAFLRTHRSLRGEKIPARAGFLILRTSLNGDYKSSQSEKHIFYSLGFFFVPFAAFAVRNLKSGNGNP